MSAPPADRTRPGRSRRYYWERAAPDARPPGQDLAAFRRGLNREPGAVPEMWAYYTTLTADGYSTPDLIAEHSALSLFGVHQQSQPTLVHRPGIGLGTAMLALRRSGKYSEGAVDHRFAAAATAGSVTELTAHLRGLITQLRSVPGVHALDYTRLLMDIRDWQRPESAGRVRLRWGSQYFAPGDHENRNNGEPDAPKETVSAPTGGPR